MRVLAGWLRVALIDLRGDLRRFGVLLACLALGVGTIAIVGSVGAALQSALARDARLVLGGDLEAQISYRPAEAAERELFERLGRTAEVIEVMGNGRTADNSAFLALRGVDGNYPLIGQMDVLNPAVPGASLAESLAERDGVFGIVPDQLLLDRLGLRVGDRLDLGEAGFTIRGTIGGLPDQITQGMLFGIPTLISIEGLAATKILEPGVLAQYRYKVLLNLPDFAAAAAGIRTAFPDAGWQVNSPRDATADLERFFDIFSRFLTIVGLSSLLVGGVGVSNAISAYVTERQRSIATLRALGATSARIMVHFLTQVLLLTLLGVGLGIGLGAVLTFVALPIIGDLLAIDLPPVLDVASLLTATGFGILIGFAFGYLPLRRAQGLRPALLFRSAGSAVEGGLGWRELVKPGLWLPLVLAIAGIYGLAVLTTGRPLLVLWYALGAAGAFLVLRLAAFVLQRALRLVPPLPDAGLRNALKNIHRPGAPAPAVILSLGLGLALLLLIAMIDNNLRHQLDREAIPDAPSFVFMDLFEDEVADLASLKDTDARIASFSSMPMMLGSIDSVNGVKAAELGRPPPELAFVFEGEVPMTASAAVPQRSTVVAGEWWPADYAGAPQVSVFKDLREPLGLKLGDKIALHIFGEPVTATITSFRDFIWRGGGVNFAFVLSPNVLDAFSVSYLGFLKTNPGEERAVQQTLVDSFPDLIFLPVSEALATIATILGSVTNAVAVIGGLAVVSGLFVLAGAMAAGRRQREADAVVMKVLGATRTDVFRAYLIEYGLLGALSAVLASALGLAGTWAFVELVLEIDFSIDPLLIAWVMLGAVVMTIAVGTLTTWSALSVKPAQFLREE